ncbi:double-stranded RNA-specific editase B2-like [Pholidichthys leucotaenia]
MVSPFISSIKHWDTEASSAEDADSSSISSLEVKENQDNKCQLEHELLRKYHPSTFCTTFPRHGTRALKRKQQVLEGKDLLIYQSPLTCKRGTWAVTQKNALMQLNELRPGLQYEIISKIGPLHAPIFSVGVEVNGFHFEGRGRTKKQAKMRAAELALRSFIQFPNAPQAHAAMGTFSSTPMDFTTDKFSDTFVSELEFESCNLMHYNTKKEVIHSIYCHRLTLGLVSPINPGQDSPVALLSELRPGLRFVCLTERIHGRSMRRFVMVVRLDGRVFEGCGKSKRLAKARAAAAALLALYNISLGPERTTMGLQGSRSKNHLPQLFAESIFHLVREKYTELTDSCLSTSHARYKVLAGIVMTRGLDLKSAQVVALAMGTKCVDSVNVGDRAYTLTDCHAEVISRRALVRFLYAQLELLLCKPRDGEQQSIFVPNTGCSRGFRLHDDVHFHMYVSTSPCGDARLNCPYETTAPHSSRRFRGHLRAKVNGGEGTLPVTAQTANQKLDGLMPGRALVSMSCTDKMAKWSVVGLQGALLSHLVEPIYLYSLTVGTLSHTGHLGRAMARRLALIKHLPLPYRRQQLLLGCLSSINVQLARKAPNLSLNWSYGDEELEEISTPTGRRKDSGMPSRLCRHSLFSRWLRLQQQLNGPVLDMEETEKTYFTSKMASGQYQNVVQLFSSALQDGGLGTWLRKPQRLGHFCTTLQEYCSLTNQNGRHFILPVSLEDVVMGKETLNMKWTCSSDESSACLKGLTSP